MDDTACPCHPLTCPSCGSELQGWPCSDGRTNPDGSITVWSDIRIQIEWAPGHVSKPAPVAGEERSSSLPFPSAFIE